MSCAATHPENFTKRSVKAIRLLDDSYNPTTVINNKEGNPLKVIKDVN